MALRRAEMLFPEALVVLPTPVHRRRRRRLALEGEALVEPQRCEISETPHLEITEQQTDGVMVNTIVEIADPLLRVVGLQFVSERTRGIAA
jgi:hypothetical protein